jgi:hypothetical protein
MRFGLCCLFKQEKIPFRTTTAKALLALSHTAICHHLGLAGPQEIPSPMPITSNLQMCLPAGWDGQ